jgi:hypothetical protein
VKRSLLWPFFALLAFNPGEKKAEPERAPAQRPALKIADIQDHLLLGRMYRSPEYTLDQKTISIVPQISEVVFGFLPKDSAKYVSAVQELDGLRNFEGDSGMELLLYLQIVWEQRFGPQIRHNRNHPTLSREGAAYSGTLLGFASSIAYSRSKVGKIHRLVSSLMPYVGLVAGYGVAKISHDPKSENGVPPSPFQITGFGNRRPEDARWDNVDSLAWNLFEVMAGFTVYPVGKAVANRASMRFMKTGSCKDAATFVLNHYLLKQRGEKFLTDFKVLGLGILNRLRGVKNGAKNSRGLPWRDAFVPSRDEVAGFRDYTMAYIRAWGPVGVAGGVAAFIGMQASLDEYSERSSNHELRDHIKDSEAQIERYYTEGRTTELLAEAYHFRELIEYYFDVMMIERTERTEEQLLNSAMPKKMDAQEFDSNNADKINSAIQKTYTAPEWNKFKARLAAFMLAKEEFADQQMPGLYREVLTDGLPDDPGNILLYGAAILHKHKMTSEFERASDKIRKVFNFYNALNSQPGVQE